jgi:RNA polymerase sigma-70 factor (ECF subfamily)
MPQVDKAMAAKAATDTPSMALPPERDARVSPGIGRTPSGIDGLVDQARCGDHRAFEEIVRQTYTDTYTLAFRLTGDEEDARDVVQETYLRVHRGIARFRGDAQFTTWLHRVTANCASTFLGRRGRHRHERLPDDAAIADDNPQGDPAGRADVGQLRAQLTDALRSLPPKLRVVIVLRDIYDLSHEAIAAELGISESAAKVRLHRARKRLRERLYPLHGDLADAEFPPSDATESDPTPSGATPSEATESAREDRVPT